MNKLFSYKKLSVTFRSVFKINLLIFVVCFLLSDLSFSQKYYTPDSKITAQGNNITVNKLENLIQTYKPKNTNEKIKEVIKKAESNNNAVETKISELKNKITRNNLAFQDFVSLTEVVQDKIKLKGLEENLKEINENIRKSMLNYSFKSLYVCLQKADAYADQTKLAAKAIKYITPEAVANINGTYIQSITKIANNVTVRDYVKAVKSGKVTASGSVIIARLLGSSEIFIYMNEIEVSPLEGKLSVSDYYNSGSSDVLVIDLLNDFDYETKLRKFGLADNKINDIVSKTNGKSQMIKNMNDATSLRQASEIKKSNKNRKEIENKIFILKNYIKNKEPELKSFFNEIGLNYSSSSINSSIKAAKNYFIDTENRYKQQIKEQLEKRIEISDKIPVTSKKSFATAIAEAAPEHIDNLKAVYAKRRDLYEVTEVENAVTASLKAGTKISIIRKIDRVWLYPQITDDDIYYVTILSSFKVIGEDEGGSSNNYTSTSGNYTETTANLNLQMVAVKGGTYKMGSNVYDSEKPIHSVTVSDFYIGKYEITHKQFIKFLNDYGVSGNGSYNGQELIDMDDSDCAIGYNANFYFKGSSTANSEQCPVIEVTWYGATEFAKWTSSKTSKNYSLPTEAEWEFAARGGNKSRSYKYAGSNNINDVAEYEGNNDTKTKPVGGKAKNELGIYDMSGNVWEWCNDWYSSSYYSSSPQNNPQGPAGFAPC